MMDTSFLVGNAPTPLLNPLDIQARKIAIRNALAAGALQDQQTQANALALQQQKQALTDDQATRAAMLQYYGGGAPAQGAPAPPVAPPPAAPGGALPFDPQTGMNPDPTGGASMAAPPPAPAAAPVVPPAPPIPTMADLVRRGVPPAQASALIQQFQKVDETNSTIAKTRAEAAKVTKEANDLVAQQAAEMADGIIKVTPAGQPINADLLDWHLQHFASLGPQEAQQAQAVKAQLAQMAPGDQIAFLTTIANTPKQMEANAAQITANEKKQSSDREADKQARGQALSALAAAPNSAAYGAIWGQLSPELRKDASIPKPEAWTPQTAAVLQGTGMSSDQQVTTAQTASHNAATEANEKRARDQEQQRINLERQKTSFDQGAIQRAGESLGRGELTRISDIASLRGDQRLQIYDIAKRVNPNFNVSEVDRKVKNEDYYANGKGADSLRSFNTFLEHAGGASDAVNNIRLSGVPVINKPLNWWREHLSGSADYQQLVGSLEPVRKEFEGYLLGGHALQAGDRQAAEVILNDNSSPAMIQQALKTMGHTAVARAREENFRYKKLSGHDLVDAFSPEAMDGAKKIGTEINFGSSGAAPAAPAAGGSLPVGASHVPAPGATFNGQKVLSVTRVE